MRNTKIRFMSEIGIFVGLALVLHFLATLYSTPIFPAGGEISLAMIPIILFALRWGLKSGLLAGFLFSTLQLTYSPVFTWGLSWYVLLFVIIVDYILAYTSLGLAGLFKKSDKELTSTEQLYITTNAVLLSGGARTFFHILSGWIFWRNLVPTAFKSEYPWFLWSLIYNLGYMVPTLIITLFVLRALIKRQGDKLLNPNEALYKN